MEPEGSFPCSQDPATGPWVGPDESNPHRHTPVSSPDNHRVRFYMRFWAAPGGTPTSSWKYLVKSTDCEGHPPQTILTCLNLLFNCFKLTVSFQDGTAVISSRVRHGDVSCTVAIVRRSIRYIWKNYDSSYQNPPKYTTGNNFSEFSAVTSRGVLLRSTQQNRRPSHHNSRRNAVQIELFLCLTKHHAKKKYCGSGSIVPRILNRGARWRWPNLESNPGRPTHSHPL
jgi:hypothetical protein